MSKENMKLNDKLCVGQKLWLVRSALHNRGTTNEPIEVTISIVGKKYFQLVEYPRAKFEIKTLKQSTESNYFDMCYLTLQEILDEREASKLEGKIKTIFSGYGKSRLTLEQLRQINDIIRGNHDD